MNSLFKTLKNDFATSQMPSPHDPLTVMTLCRIADAIQSGETTLNEFEDYLAENHMGRTPLGQRKPMPFGDACYTFVSDVLTYFDAKTR